MAAGVARKFFIGGNWKNFGTRSSVASLVNNLNAAGDIPKILDAVVAPVALHIDYVSQHLKHGYQVSTQNVAAYPQGAYTGEISADIVKDFGVNWTLVGHSERRTLFGDTDDIVTKKIALAQQHGLSVIACFGETIDERKADQTLAVVTRQLTAIAAGVKDWSGIVLAYEPVWAIGTGLNATAAQAQEVHGAIRKWLADKINADVARQTRVIYGGSVKPNNCDELIAQPDIDGFLVGGASLIAADFLKILTSPTRVNKTKAKL